MSNPEGLFVQTCDCGHTHNDHNADGGCLICSCHDYEEEISPVTAVLVQIEDLSLNEQVGVLADALDIVLGHVLSFAEDMRQEVSPID